MVVFLLLRDSYQHPSLVSLPAFPHSTIIASLPFTFSAVQHWHPPGGRANTREMHGAGNFSFPPINDVLDW